MRRKLTLQYHKGTEKRTERSSEQKELRSGRLRSEKLRSERLRSERKGHQFITEYQRSSLKQVCWNVIEFFLLRLTAVTDWQFRLQSQFSSVSRSQTVETELFQTIDSTEYDEKRINVDCEHVLRKIRCRCRMHAHLLPSVKRTQMIQDTGLMISKCCNKVKSDEWQSKRTARIEIRYTVVWVENACRSITMLHHLTKQCVQQSLCRVKVKKEWMLMRISSNHDDTVFIIFTDER